MTHPRVISVPGRVNLIGEHIDYHNLPVLPMAIQRRVSITFQNRGDALIQATSPGYAERRFSLSDAAPFASGDWGNYLKAAVQMIRRRWTLAHGIDAAISSDLPIAAGLSSSSALLTGFALAPVALVRSVGQVEIVFTLAFGRWYLREPLKARDMAGVLLIVLSVVLVILG